MRTVGSDDRAHPPEAELLRSEPIDFLTRWGSHSGASDDLDFAVARAAKQAGDIKLAASLFTGLLNSRDPVLAARASAHLAHIDYYTGHFDRGVERASASAAISALTRAENLVYLSANLIALNDGRRSLEAAREARRLAARGRTGPLHADLRFRCARQLVHVLVACGEYLEAASEAETAAASVRALGDHRRLGYAAYLRGVVRASRGHADATVDYADAERHWLRLYPNLQSWLRVAWAVLLRDLGILAAAELVRPRDRELPSWEGPLFALARGDRPTVPNLDDAPSDERPFLLATRGLLRLRMRNGAGAERDLAEAVLTFDRGGLHHYRRGAALTLAFAHALQGRRELAIDMIANEAQAIVAAEVRRWPWWQRDLVRENEALLQAAGLPESVRHGVTTVAHEPLSDATLLRARGLTEREAQVVRTWIANPQYTRQQLAHALGIRESSVRTHLNSARRKLDLTGRGPLGLRASIDAIRSGRKYGLL